MSSRPSRALAPELAEWLVYLKEIGVRELHVPHDSSWPGGLERTVGGPAAPRTRPQAATSARDPVPSPAVSKRAAVAQQPASSLLSILGAELLGPAPEDPAVALRTIREELGECTRCKLSEGRTNIVFGVGDPCARLMFIGEGPGADEDAQGEPFVGRAGKKLDEMIRAIGLEREQVYIANVVKCRPPRNRDPEPDEVETCTPFLFRQIAAIRPRVIVTLGAPAARTLLNTKIGITKLRGQWHEYGGIPVLPTFHPAYLLRAYTPENRRKVWEDLKAARARLDEPR